MLHSYKFIYDNMAYVTFHGVISEDYPELENQARASFNNAISWKDLNAQNNAQLKMALNKAVATKNVATLPLLSDVTATVVNGGFVVTGKNAAENIRIDGERLYINGTKVWPEGKEELEPITQIVIAPEEPEPVQEISKPELTVVQEPNDVILDTAVMQERHEAMSEITTVAQVTEDVEKIFDPTVDFHRLPVGFIFGKSVDKPALQSTFKVGFVKGNGRSVPSSPRVIGSTEEHFVWCEEYAKTHKPTWEPLVEKEDDEHEGDAFDDIFGDNVSLVNKEQKPPKSRLGTGITKKTQNKSWEELLAEKRDIDANHQDFTPEDHVKEQLRSSVRYQEQGSSSAVPEFMHDIPREFLGNINAYTTADIDKEMLQENGTAYCIQKGWANIGQWYCIDVVSSASRYFYNEVAGVSQSIPFSVCKEVLKQIGG